MYLSIIRIDDKCRFIGKTLVAEVNFVVGELVLPSIFLWVLNIGVVVRGGNINGAFGILEDDGSLVDVVHEISDLEAMYEVAKARIRLLVAVEKLFIIDFEVFILGIRDRELPVRDVLGLAFSFGIG